MTNTVYFLGTEMSQASYLSLKERQLRESRDAAAAEAALYKPNADGVPQVHTRKPDVDVTAVAGYGLPLTYAGKPIQDARKALDKLSDALAALEETAEVLRDEYDAVTPTNADAVAKAALAGKPLPSTAAQLRKEREKVARQYEDCVIQRDAVYGAVKDTCALVDAETAKGLAAWHDAIGAAWQKQAADAAPVIKDLGTKLAPLMRDVLALAGHVQSARDGLNCEGHAPQALVDLDKLSEALSALEAAPTLWDALTADPVLSLTAEQFEKAHVASHDWKAYEKRAEAIEAYRQHYAGVGQRVLSHEEAAAVINGAVKSEFGTGFSGH